MTKAAKGRVTASRMLTSSPKISRNIAPTAPAHDEVMLDGLDEQIAAMAGDRLVTLHLMGSHGPTYYKRYPDEHRFFTPDCPAQRY